MMLGITEGTMKILIKSNTHTDTHTHLQPHFLVTLIDQPPNNFKLRQGEIIYKLTQLFQVNMSTDDIPFSANNWVEKVTLQSFGP